MTYDKKPSVYSDRGTIGSAEELDAYGVWVKSEPQDIAGAMPYDPDFDTGFDIPEGEPSPVNEIGDFSGSSDFADGSFANGNFAEDSAFAGSSIVGDNFADGNFADSTGIANGSFADGNFADSSFVADGNFADGSGSEEVSTHLLMKIADELASIRTELTTLKKEFADIRAEGAPAAAPRSDFFAEEEDEKITLTGDEMNNILSSATISGEDELDSDAQREKDAAALKELSAQKDAEENIDIVFDNLDYTGEDAAQELSLEALPHEDDFEPLPLEEELAPPPPLPDTEEFTLSELDEMAGIDETEALQELSGEVTPIESIEPLSSADADELRDLRLEGAAPLTPPPDDSVYLETDPFHIHDSSVGIAAAEMTLDDSDFDLVVDDFSEETPLEEQAEEQAAEDISIEMPEVDEEPAPQETASQETVPIEEISIDELVLDDITPEVAPQEASLEEASPQEEVLEEAAPEEAALEEVTPEEVAPEEEPLEELALSEEPAIAEPAFVAAPQEMLSDELMLDETPMEEMSFDEEPLPPMDLSDAVIDEPDLSAGISEAPLEEPSLNDISLSMDDFDLGEDFVITDEISSGGDALVASGSDELVDDGAGDEAALAADDTLVADGAAADDALVAAGGDELVDEGSGAVADDVLVAAGGEIAADAAAVDVAAIDEPLVDAAADDTSHADDFSSKEMDFSLDDFGESVNLGIVEGADSIDDGLTKVIPEALERNAVEAAALDDDFEVFADEDVPVIGDELARPAEPALKAEAASSGAETGLSPDIQSELKKVLSYMDHLLESLPEDKIEEFAKSEYFDSYKKLFKDLGLV